MPVLKRIALIVAGGTGTRMGNEIPKQFLVLRGKPVLMHTIEKFFSRSDEVIVVLPADWISHWQSLCEDYKLNVGYKTVIGGVTRAASVRNGLNEIDSNAIVAVHDAARPLISTALIDKLYIVAGEQGSAVPVVTLRDSIRIIEGNANRAVDRSAFRLVQTPQCFIAGKLLESFNNIEFEIFTDEASLMEASGQTVFLVEGEHTNIKLTHPEDFIYAEHLTI